MSLFEELKRRNVFRVGIAYAVSAWVLLQVVDLVLDNSDIPGWVMQAFMLLAALGFIVALVVSWAFEVTPEGIKREKDVDRSQSITHQTGQKLNFVTLAAAALVVVLFAVDRMLPAPEPAAQPGVAAAGPESTGVAAADEEPPAPDGLARGVAVLPFENLSEDPANAFFAGGMHEDVLTHISRIAGLRVISRTSMIRVAERGLDVREIGRQLGISHVLEGSVRRAGEQVRVTVQLIDAATDEHLWAENYDRRLDDIFAIQSEIAQAIAAQLQTELSAETKSQIEAVPTRNMAAYQLYLQARELDRVWRGSVGFAEQRVLLEEAVALDPGFLDAQVKLAMAYGRLYWTGADPDGSYRDQAEALTAYIERNWPERPEAVLARGNYEYTVNRDYQRALDAYQGILPQFPNNPQLLNIVASSYKRLGQYDLGLPVIREAVSLDPENASMAGELVMHLQGAGHLEEALATSRRNAERFPGSISEQFALAVNSLTLAGDLDTYFMAWEEIRRLDPEGSVTRDPQMGNEYRRLLRMRLAADGPDALVAELNAATSEANPWTAAWRDLTAAELLLISGREPDGRLRARAALDSVERNLSEGRALPANTPKIYYTYFSYFACLAGDQGAYNRYRAVANTIPAAELLLGRTARSMEALALAACGDAAAGWVMLAPLREQGDFTDWELALDPLYAHYFGQLPEFQALVANTPAQRPAAEG